MSRAISFLMVHSHWEALPLLPPLPPAVQERPSPPHRRAGCAVGMMLDASRLPPGPPPNRYYLFWMSSSSATTTCSHSPRAAATRPMPSSPVGARRYLCLSPPTEDMAQPSFNTGEPNASRLILSRR